MRKAQHRKREELALDIAELSRSIRIANHLRRIAHVMPVMLSVLLCSAMAQEQPAVAPEYQSFFDEKEFVYRIYSVSGIDVTVLYDVSLSTLALVYEDLNDYPSGAPVIAGTEGVSHAKLLSKVEPEYPKEARKKRQEAKLVVTAVVNEYGIVSDVEVVSCTNPGYSFESAAVEAIEQWRYEPAQKNGEPVVTYLVIQTSFSTH
jgi:TonB family protein